MAITNRTRCAVAALALATDDANMDRLCATYTEAQLDDAVALLIDMTRAVNRARAAHQIDAAHDDGHRDYNYTHFAPEPF